MTPESLDYEAGAVLAVLKHLLRERRIGYQSIAKALGVSLPTVKRMLNKPNLPVDRLFAICRIAQIDPVDVFSEAAKARPRHTFFTAEQDELFFKQPEFLSYFQKLTAEGLTPDEIAASENLTAHSTQTYLAGLERVGLIERETGTKFRLLLEPPFGFGPESRVLRAKHVEFLQHTVTQVLAVDREPGVFALLKPLRLNADLYAEMLGELRALVDKYAYHSEHHTNRDLPDREDWNLAIAAGPGTDEEAAPLKQL